jgi:type IV pilus assembly protein PilB
VDLRVSTLPTQFGESVVLRVLDQSAVGLELDQLGLPPAMLAVVRDLIARPNGIFIVTGPTGSGKTTTLYSCLKILNQPATKILTVEDPVEYEIDGVMQVGVNPAAGLDFARSLRAFLRQDPDVVMVGEIRDAETAQIAIQAALTGHLVLATLHTNDAPGAITRLVDMGVEPYLLAATITGVLAQRLVRRLCPHCRVMSGAGCPACFHTGYHGRLGLFQFMPLTEEIRDLITARASHAQLRQLAEMQGMTSLRAAGDQAILAGLTTAEEVGKYI